MWCVTLLREVCSSSVCAHYTHTHTDAHTHRHTHTHTNIHTHTHTHTHARTHTHTHARTHTHAHTHARTHTHTCTTMQMWFICPNTAVVLDKVSLLDAGIWLSCGEWGNPMLKWNHTLLAGEIHL